MLYAARPAGDAGASWVVPNGVGVDVGETNISQAWLAGASQDELEARGIERAEVAGTPPDPSLGAPPTLQEVDGALAWVWSEDGLTSLRQACISGIKAEARRRILAVMDEDQQRNAMMLVGVMVTTVGPDPADWPTDKRAAHEANLPKLALIEAIRSASNDIEADLPDTAAELAAFDVANHPAWPA